MKYHVLFADGTLSLGFTYKSLAEELADICGWFTYIGGPVAIITVMPREERIEHEMEAQLRSVFSEIEGVTFSHQ